MSHPLRQDERHGAAPLGRPYAAIGAQLERDRLVVSGAPFIAKADTLWFPLPARLQVVAPGGEEVRPSPGRRFFISAETIDPWHSLLEAEDVPIPRRPS